MNLFSKIKKKKNLSQKLQREFFRILHAFYFNCVISIPISYRKLKRPEKKSLKKLYYIRVKIIF